ncbi:magnesium transporter [Prauserella shujinwangii]|uniref:Magnesium transporter MgtE n=1 Tax=Prauserella shujinwangii TaxID=1453103 RepID=A0A2T0LMV7_9PSEU|nr:magnesium transporter [Prauserella shujinwangii]PRX44527.1 magnesium transporter [Prauserella shujinwangii]
MAAQDLRQLVDTNDIPALQQWLVQHAPHEIADEIGRADPLRGVLLFRLLDKDRALEVFEELDPSDQHKILSGLRDHAFRDVVEAMDPDDRARLLGEAPAKFARHVLGGLSPHERTMTAALLGYPDGSVGRYMSPETVAIRRHLTAGEALRVVRERGADAETIYTLPVIDDERRFVGTLSLRDLVLSSPDRPITELVDTTALRVQATDQAEGAARLMQEANLLDLPVVDSEDRVLGLLTIDDAVEVIEAADTEDIARQSAATPWSGHYMSAGVAQLARSRALWLLLLIAAATLTVNVLQFFEATLEQVTALALFIPLLVGTGGNAGAQAATATVRALAVGEVRTRDLFHVAWRESRVGLLLGAMLGAVGLVMGTILVDFPVAVTVALSLVLICGWAATIGATMPLLAKRLGIDPAVISAPLVTTLVDATGLVIYFLIAHAVLPL